MKDRWGLIFHASLNGLSIEVDDYRLQTAPKFHSNEDWRCCCQMKSGALNRSCIIYTCEYYVWRKRQQMKNLYFTFSKSDGNWIIYHSDAVTPWRQRAEEKKNLQKNSQLKFKKKKWKESPSRKFQKRRFIIPCAVSGPDQLLQLI